MADTLSVYTALPWTDYGRRFGWQWTVGGKINTFIQLLIGISFGLAQPFLERIVSHQLGWICYCVEKYCCKSSAAGPREADDRTSLSGQGQRSRSCCCPPIGSIRCDRHCTRYWIAKALSLLIMVFGIAYMVAGTFITTIPKDQAALSGSTKCGVWGLTGNAQGEAQDKDALIQGQKETRASQYARDCYGPQSAASLGQCSIFKESQIPAFKEEREQLCPFVNETYCWGDGFPAVKFTTGLVDATFIGVNAKKAPKFTRTMICVPLNLRQGFVEKTSSLAGHWAYNLGPVESHDYSSKYTFRQFGDPFSFDVRSYTMSTYTHVYSKASWQNYWMPIPELNVRPGLSNKTQPYSITIMFINSCRIFYREGSGDPIFPADKTWPPNPNLWTNNDSKARPLACIDWLEICKHDGKDCVPPYEEAPNDDKNFVFTQYALNKSTAFHAIEFQGANGLRAQEKIKDDTSLPLNEDPPQWIVESWALFNTSLSRIQYDALDIANGTGWDKEPKYDQKLPKWARGHVCNIFTFQLPVGYDNVRIWPTIGILLIPLALWLMGLETQFEFDEDKRSSRYFDKDNLLGIEWLYWKLARCGSRITPLDPAASVTIAHGQGESSNQQSGGLGRNYGTNTPTTNQPRPQIDVDGSAPATTKPSQSSSPSASTFESVDLHANEP